MSKTTFIATCPITGETATRTSAHPYTHALTVKVTSQYKRDASRPSITVRSRGQVVLPGYIRVSQPGSRSWGWDVAVIPRPAAEQTTEVRSLISFHESADLACKAAKALERGGWAVVQAVPVPCTVKG